MPQGQQARIDPNHWTQPTASYDFLDRETRLTAVTYLSTVREMMATLEPFSFSVIDVENMRLHYAKTFAHWLGRFEDHKQKVRDRYDETFVRAWRLYLASSVASFSTGWLQLYQVLFLRAPNNDIPSLYIFPAIEDQKKD